MKAMEGSCDAYGLGHDRASPSSRLGVKAIEGSCDAYGLGHDRASLNARLGVKAFL